MPDVNADAIKISVQRTGIKPATEDLSKLSDSLRSLKEVLGSFDSVKGDLPGTLESIAKATEPLAALKDRVTGLASLSTALDRISRASGKFDVTNIVSGIEQIAEAANKIDDDTIQRVHELADAYRALDSAGAASSGVPATAPDSHQPMPDSEDPLANYAEDMTNDPLANYYDSATSFLNVLERVRSVGASVFQTIERAVNNAGNALSKVGNIGKVAFNGVKNAAKITGKAVASVAGAPFKLLGKAFSGISSKVGSFIQMFKKRLLYRAINAIISAVTNGIKEGVNNLYQFSKTFDGTFSKSMDRASTSMLYFKNSLGAMAAPLINMLVPILEVVVSKVVNFVNMLNRLFAQLSGASTWTRALMYPKEYAEATNNATSSVKKFKATILGIDEINPMNDNSDDGGGGNSNSGEDYSQMFEEVALQGDAVSELFGGFFDPLKKAWDKTGSQVISGWRNAVAGIQELAGAVGGSFEEVWQNGTGEETLSHIFGITGGILDLSGNLSKSFAKAWKENDRGTRIVQAIWDIFNSILGTIEGIVKATADWAAELDFGPLLESLAGLFEKLKPLIDFIGKAITWLWVNIVLPLIKWLIEKGLPDVINILGGIIDFITGVFTGDWELAWEGIKEIVVGLWTLIWTDTLKPIVMWVYNEILVPIGQFFSDIWTDICEVVTGVWDTIKGVWETVSTWFDENVLQPIKQFFSDAWDAITGVWEAVSTWFDENVLQPLWEFFEPIFHNIEVLVTGVWDVIKAAWELVSTWFDENVIQPVSDFFEKAWEDISGWVTGAWDDIKEVWNTVSTWFDENIIQPISGWFDKLWEDVSTWASDAWEDIKTTFSHVTTWLSEKFSAAWEKVVEVFSPLGEVFVKLKEAIVNIFVKIVNGIISGINWVIALPFKGINKVLNKLKNFEILGIQPFADLKELTVPEIPLLQVDPKAEGGAVPSGTMFLAGEAGPEIVADMGHSSGVMNIHQMEDAVRDGMTEASYAQNNLLRQILQYVISLDNKDFGTEITTGDIRRALDRANRRDGRTIIPVGV